jgi:DNA-binding response OmpR family regulator
VNAPARPEILVVEDDDAARSMIVRFLGARGFVATGTGDGGVAWELLQERTFDIVVLDIMLPGLGGHEVLSRLRALPEPKRSISVIVASATGSNEQQVELLRLGADDYVVKPYSLGSLAARMHAHHRRRTVFRSAAVVGPEDHHEHLRQLDHARVPTWLGRHRHTHQLVEVKTLPPGQATRSAMETMWVRLQRLRGPGFVRLLDAGANSDGGWWWVTEAVPGRSLADDWNAATEHGLRVIESLLACCVSLDRDRLLPHPLTMTDVHLDDQRGVWLRDPGLSGLLGTDASPSPLRRIADLGRELCVAPAIVDALETDGISFAAASAVVRRLIRGA